MDGLKISEVADLTGLTASSLRFYEQTGMVSPDRAPNGYRVYDESHVEALRFISRSKAVGLTLDEITELLDLRTSDRCGPLQDRFTELVSARLADTRTRAAELDAFTADLEGLLEDLSGHRPDGPCDDNCGCITGEFDPTSAAPIALSATRHRPLRPKEDVAAAVDACSLERSELPKRLEDWRLVLAGCPVTRDAVGATITLDPDTRLSTVADLVAAESECCSFFAFEIRIDTADRCLRVTAPPAQQSMIDLLIGAAT